MRTLIFIIAILVLYSCERDNKRNVINTFPTVLIFDSWNTFKTEVYNKDGKLTNYDERFDEFEFMSFWVYDSIILINNSISVTYKSLSLPLTFQIDSFYTDLHDSYFKIAPVDIPKSIKVIDTSSENNEKTIYDPINIRSTLTWTFNQIEDEFVVPLIAIRVFSKTEGGYDLYTMIEQGCANSVDKDYLFQNLESNETLSLIFYELTFIKK